MGDYTFKLAMPQESCAVKSYNGFLGQKNSLRVLQLLFPSCPLFCTCFLLVYLERYLENVFSVSIVNQEFLQRMMFILVPISGSRSEK